MTRVIFACVHNAGRSQMAEAFMKQLADPAIVEAVSAGTAPADSIHSVVVDVMREVGIDLSGKRPAQLTKESARAASLLITMGCKDDCPYLPGLQAEDWQLDDPRDKPVEQVRRIRDEIRGRVAALIESRGWQRRDP